MMMIRVHHSIRITKCNISYFHITILSYTLMSPVSQLETQKPMTSRIWSRIEYSIQTYKKCSCSHFTLKIGGNCSLPGGLLKWSNDDHRQWLTFLHCFGPLITIRPGAGVSYRRLPARCWILTADTQISGTNIQCCNNTFGDRSFAAAGPRAWNDLPATLCNTRADNRHFQQTSQNCFVHWLMRSRHIRDILILSRRL